LQADVLGSLATRVAAPLLPIAQVKDQPRGACPTIVIDNNLLALLVPDMASTPVKELFDRVGSAAHLRDEILRAVDLVFTGV
jgi:toxin CcdB